MFGEGFAEERWQADGAACRLRLRGVEGQLPADLGERLSDQREASPSDGTRRPYSPGVSVPSSTSGPPHGGKRRRTMSGSHSRRPASGRFGFTSIPVNGWTCVLPMTNGTAVYLALRSRRTGERGSSERRGFGTQGLAGAWMNELLTDAEQGWCLGHGPEIEVAAYLLGLLPQFPSDLLSLREQGARVDSSATVTPGRESDVSCRGTGDHPEAQA
jgi:hypothetical protein